MIVGISGKSGSGKSSIANELVKKGYILFDLDSCSKKIREAYKDEIVGLVKDSNILVDDKIDSKKLGEVLFNDKKLMDEYNEFLYSKQKEILEKFIKENDKVVIDSMFLPIMDIFNLCDYKILVECQDEVRRKRILNRDNIDEEYLNKREKYALEYNKDDFDFIIDNSYGYKDKIEKVLKELE